MTEELPPRRPAAAVILAAGKGRRMRSDRPKVLHEIGGAPMLHHAMESALALAPERLVVVTGQDSGPVADAVRALCPSAAIAVQEQQLGTGHAVRAAGAALAGFDGDLFVLFADTPFVRPETLEQMRAARGCASIVALGFEAADPGNYGRFVLDADGGLAAIVEASETNAAERAITLCNSGLMAGECATMLDLLARVGATNAQGEYYLTDLVALARAEGLSTAAVICAEEETLGINDRVQLAAAEAIFQTRARRRAMLDGTTLIAPETVFFCHDTRLGRDVVVHPHVVFGPGVSVGDGSEIRSFTHLEETAVAEDVRIGPFARSRGGTRLDRGARIGNFVETKNARVGPGTKAGHLAYLGDAVLGAGVNVGAGTITCNYDGFVKHRTTIEDGAFIGVNTALIAPITVGAGAYVGTGTVLTRDVPADALALARVEQTNRMGYAARLRARLAARKKKS